MRNGIVISAVLHVTALWVSFVGVPEWMRSDPEIIEQAVIVELVTISEETRAARPKPEPVKEDKPPPSPREKPKPPPVAEAPPPVPAEPEVEVAIVVPDVKSLPAQKKPVAKPKRKPTPPPQKTVKRSPDAPKEAKPKKYKFDPDRIAALIDKTPRKQAPPEIPEAPQVQPKITSRTAPPLEGQPLTLSEVDALRAQIQRCWIVQAGARYAEDLVVTLRVFLNSDGSLRSAPQIVDDSRLATDPYFRAAAESAVRAVLKCEPFKMPVTKYDRWREIELTFDPREMLG